jgi:DNA processing protein
VDTASHCGALKAGGRTIAVLGSGFSHLYPRENQGLAAEIALSGAVISEFPLGILPLRENFPRRNRVISGLSLGVLVVEAARNSGALITADFALEQGREVFALPGEFDASNSWGTNSLIKQGAKLVSNLEDILEELAAFITPQPCRPQALIDRPSGLSEEEARAYGLLTTEAVHIDELVQKTELDISRISAILLRLQLKNLIREFPGKHYARTKDAEKELSYS